MFNKIISSLWKAWFVFLMFLTALILPFLLLLSPILPFKANRYLAWLVASNWGRITVRTTGSRVIFEGRELLPKHSQLCFMGNHQGFFDIPAFLGYLGRPVGFIAKQELFKVPVLSQWMRQLPCVFIDKKTPRETIVSFQHSAEIIKKGCPIVIFPEGGRSFSDTMADFHLGSLKLPQMAGATIVPFAIKGTWRIYEIDKGIHPVTIRIRILPPITPQDPIYNDKTALLKHLEDLIRKNVEEM